MAKHKYVAFGTSSFWDTPRSRHAKCGLILAVCRANATPNAAWFSLFAALMLVCSSSLISVNARLNSVGVVLNFFFHSESNIFLMQFSKTITESLLMDKNFTRFVQILFLLAWYNFVKHFSFNSNPNVILDFFYGHYENFVDW